MAFLVDSYHEDEAPNTKGGVDKRTVMRFDPRLSPVKVAVLPLSRNEKLSPKARGLADLTVSYEQLRARHGVTVVHASASGVDQQWLPSPARPMIAVLRPVRLAPVVMSAVSTPSLTPKFWTGITLDWPPASSVA